MVRGIETLYPLIKLDCVRPITTMIFEFPRVVIRNIVTVLHRCNQLQISALASHVNLREARHFSLGMVTEILATDVVEMCH
jgi:hypothetical protein